jgi:nucleoside 2-deoxyribosyltransferase
MHSVYLIGSLRNPAVPELGRFLRDHGFDVFDDWYAAGERADDCWQAYEQARGRDYETALYGYAAEHTFAYDKYHLDRCDSAVLMLPAGKSGHLELGYMIGCGKPSLILLGPDQGRWDVMYRFATAVCSHRDELVTALRESLEGKRL